MIDNVQPCSTRSCPSTPIGVRCSVPMNRIYFFSQFTDNRGDFCTGSRVHFPVLVVILLYSVFIQGKAKLMYFVLGILYSRI